MVHAVRARIPHRQLPTVRASVLTAKTSTESMSSSTSSSSKRAIAADAAKKARAAVFAWNADPASVANKVSDAASAILMGGGGFAPGFTPSGGGAPFRISAIGLDTAPPGR